MLPSGLAVLVAPSRAVQATVAVHAVSGWLVPMLAATEAFRTVCDAGRVDPAVLPPVVSQAGLTVVVVRQAQDSAPATTARVERAVELVGRLAQSDIETGLVVIGAGPYRPDELAELSVHHCWGRSRSTPVGPQRRVGRGRWVARRVVRSSRGAARSLAVSVWAHLDAVSPAGIR